MKKAQREMKEQNKEKVNCHTQCTNTTAEATKPFEAKQLNEGFEYDSDITTATIEVGLKDNGQGIAATEKGLTDNDHSDHQKEGTSRAQITETSPVQLKTPVQADDLPYLFRQYKGEDTKEFHTMPKSRIKVNPERNDVWKSEASRVGGQRGRRLVTSL